MKLVRMEPMAAVPAQAVDYDAELKELEERGIQAPELDVGDEAPKDALQEETKQGFQRFVDFLAKQQHQAPNLKDRKRALVHAAYLKVRDLDDNSLKLGIYLDQSA